MTSYNRLHYHLYFIICSYSVVFFVSSENITILHPDYEYLRPTILYEKDCDICFGACYADAFGMH